MRHDKIPLNDEQILRLMRRKTRRNGRVDPQWSLRLFVLYDPKLKARRVEIGLGSGDKNEALREARGVFAFLRAWGFKVTNTGQAFTRDQRTNTKQLTFSFFAPTQKS
jgi:hypothetical protein